MEKAAVPSGTAEVDRDLWDLAGGALISVVGKAGRISRGAFIWVVTLLCGLEVQGLYSLAWGLVSTLNKVARFGLQRGVVRFVVQAKADDDNAEVERSIAAALAIGLLASALVAGGGALVAERLAASYEKPIAGAVRVLLWSTPLLTASWIFVSATRALRIMRFEVYVTSIAGPLILLAGGLVAGLTGLGLEGIAWAQVGMAVGSCALAAYYFKHCFSLSNSLHRLGWGLPWKEMGRFSLPVMLTDLLSGVLTQLDVLMLGWFVPAEQVYLLGIYVLARRLASAMLKAAQAFDPIFSAVVSELSSQDRQQELGERFVVISRWVLTINLPIFVGILILGDYLLALLGGSKVLSLSPADVGTGLRILFVLCAGMMVHGLFSLIEPLQAMSGRPGLNLLNNAIWLAANFSLNIWLIEAHGIEAAAWGAALAMGLVNAIRLVQIYLMQGIFPFRRSQLKPLLAGGGAALAASGLHALLPEGKIWAMVPPVVALVGVYGALLYLLGIEPEDRALLVRAKGVLPRWTRRPGTPARGQDREL